MLDQTSMGDTDPRTPGACRYYYATVWGTISRPPTMRIGKRSNRPMIEFSVCYRRGQYANLRAMSDNPYAYAIAQQLLIGDPVVVWAHITERDYVPRRGHYAGKKRIERKGEAQMICSMRLQAGVFEALRNATETPDILEGLDEYLRQTGEQLVDKQREKFDEIPF